MTKGADGAAVPKQYCAFAGARSLLGDALARADRIADRARVVVVVAREHEPWWSRELRGRPPGTVMVQPADRGTAAGILLPLLAVRARDPQAVVALLPSDHFVADEAVLARTLRQAQRAVRRRPDRVLLVGMAPDCVETGYGWILPGPGTGPVRTIRRFVEKPEPEVAGALLRAGAVWSSFLVVATARALIELYAARLPELLAVFLVALVDRGPVRLEELYATLPVADFCRDVLEGAEDRLGLCIAPACGWTDLGTPARVAACVSRLPGSGRAPPPPGSLAAAIGAWSSRSPSA